MNDDMPWVDLTPEEIQELRSKKQELTEYGKQKLRELMNDGKLRFYDKGKETLTIDDSSWGKCQSPEIKLEVKEMSHEEMLEEAARREAIVAKVSDEDLEKVMDAAARQELINEALEELNAIVLGGQNTREFYRLSIVTGKQIGRAHV